MKKSDILVSGFALFAMFFGAGNLIFPPYLGMTGGSSWWLGFLCFALVEVVLSCLGIYAMIAAGGSVPAMRDSVGRAPGAVLNTAAILCTGVFIAPPRTAATTYEMAIAPLTDKLGLFPFSVLFFAAVLALTIRRTRIVDIIGKFLTPILIVGILLLIAVGIARPIGPLAPSASAHIAQDGLVAGYQAMDIISVAGFTIVVQNNLRRHGYTDQREQRRAAAASSALAGALLCLIYGGLTYLGATTSGGFGHGLDQAGLIVAITHELLGRGGVAVLGVVVGCACLTTAIGLFGATAAYFEEITGGRLRYQVSIPILALIGLAICNLGLSAIIEIAAPVLSVISPPFITTVFLLLFRGRIANANVYKGAALGAALASLLIALCPYWSALAFVETVPFYRTGFGWLLPAAAGGLCGAWIRPARRAENA